MQTFYFHIIHCWQFQFPNLFLCYSGGIYEDKLCDEDNLDHGVLVIGYDVTKQGQEYWVVKNSWGSFWGKEGYIWMAKYKNNMCGIATAASYPLVQGECEEN